MQCEIFLQRLDLIVSLEFLPEADDRIQRQHEKDDDKVFPMPNHSGEYRGDFDHPRDRSPQERQEPLEWADMLFFDGIRTVLLESARRLFLGQSMLDSRMELGERLLDRPGIGWFLYTFRRISLGLIFLGPICLRRISLGGVSLGYICGT